MRAAGAAAVGVRVGLGTLFHPEGVAAAAGGGGVRVVDREAGRLDRVDVVDLGAFQVGSAGRVDDDLDAMGLDLVVADCPPRRVVTTDADFCTYFAPI